MVGVFSCLTDMMNVSLTYMNFDVTRMASTKCTCLILRKMSLSSAEVAPAMPSGQVPVATDHPNQTDQPDQRVYHIPEPLKISLVAGFASHRDPFLRNRNLVQLFRFPQPCSSFLSSDPSTCSILVKNGVYFTGLGKCPFLGIWFPPKQISGSIWR